MTSGRRSATRSPTPSRFIDAAQPACRGYGSDVDVAIAKEALTAERERVVLELTSTREGLQHSFQTHLEVGNDDAVAILDGELDKGVLEDAAATLAEIDLALTRIATGTYGACVLCAAQIPDARLKALPATALCVECQRREEHR